MAVISGGVTAGVGAVSCGRGGRETGGAWCGEGCGVRGVSCGRSSGLRGGRRGVNRWKVVRGGVELRGWAVGARSPVAAE